MNHQPQISHQNFVDCYYNQNFVAKVNMVKDVDATQMSDLSLTQLIFYLLVGIPQLEKTNPFYVPLSVLEMLKEYSNRNHFSKGDKEIIQKMVFDRFIIRAKVVTPSLF